MTCPTDGWYVEWFDEAKYRWVVWWVYDSQHSAECAAGHAGRRMNTHKVRIEYRGKKADTLF